MSNEVDTKTDDDNYQSNKSEFVLISPLFDAAIDDDYLSVQSLLSKDYDVNTQDSDGITALHLCAYFNCLATCKTLCSRRAFINGKDRRLLTPLFYACKTNSSTIVKTLIDCGADCEAQNESLRTPLHICALSSDAESAIHVLPHVSNIDTSDQQGLTALHYACISGNVEVARLLIEKGANVNLFDRDDNSPLHWASRSGSVEIVRLLLESHANRNCVNKQGITPLIFSLMSHHRDCALTLLNKNVNVQLPNHNGSSPIHFAALMADKEIFDQILNQSTPRALIDTDRFGNNLFHFAAATITFDHSSFIAYLIEKLDISLINTQNSNGQTPLHIAIIHGNQDIVESLLAAGADSSQKDKDGNTPLHLSINIDSSSSIVSALINNNPSLLCEPNKTGLIPLHIALKATDYPLIDSLLPEVDGHLIEYAQQSLLVPDSDQCQALHYAARAGLTKFIQRYYKDLEKSVINQQDVFGLTPLHHACLNWFGLDAIESLLNFGADVNLRCSTYGAIPLHYILVYSFSSDIIEQLVRAGSDVTIKTKQGYSSLSYGIIQNDNYLLQSLFTSTKIAEEEMLNLIGIACIHGKDNALAFLLENLDPLVDLNKTLYDGMNPLMLACAHGHHSCVHLLLDRKVRLDVVNPLNGMTTIHYASLNSQSQCIFMILHELPSNGVDIKSIVNQKDHKGKTALHYCVEHSAPNCIEFLIRLGGADTNLKDNSELTPIHYCALYNGEESLQELLEVNNIDVQVVDQHKRLPLHYAAASGNVTILSALTDYDYNDVADIDGFSPLHYAVLRGHETAVRTLLNSDIGIQCFKTSRITPIHLACLRSDGICLKELLHSLHQKNIEQLINLPTKTDQITPLHLACMFKAGSECVQQLLNYENINVDAQDHLQRTPIMYAILNGLDSTLIESLINRSKNIDLCDHLKNTVLHYGCLTNNQPIVEFLLRKSSSLSIDEFNNENQRPLDLAKQSGMSVGVLNLLYSLTGRF